MSIISLMWGAFGFECEMMKKLQEISGWSITPQINFIYLWEENLKYKLCEINFQR